MSLEPRSKHAAEYQWTHGRILVAIIAIIVAVMVLVAATTENYGLLIVIGFFALYFAPSIMAYKRNKHNKGAILTLNTLLGWTLLGWVVALIWAESKDSENTIVTAPSRSSIEDLEKLADLKVRGLLTEEEFEGKKKKILEA